MRTILEELRGLFSGKEHAVVDKSPGAGNVARAICFIVDDDPEICQALSAAAIASVTQPESFSSIKRLAAGLARRTPALVFLDMTLEGSDAIDGIRLLAKSGFPGLVQLISGADGELLEEVRLVGEQHELKMLPPLTKPLDPERVNEVFQLLRSRNEAGGAISVDLDEAFQQSWVEFWYQPKIDLRKKVLAGAELLARVNHPQHGVLGPNTFVARADARSMFRLTQQALREALQAGVEYAEAGFNLRLSINVPVSALMQLQVPAIVREYHRGRGDWPGLILEVTEDQMLADPGAIKEIAIQLKLCGVLLSIDDFGHGYSSLSRIRDLPLCELKIDHSFTSNCDTDKHNAALCQTIVDLAHRVGCGACAEGIETVGELTTLRSMGCDFGQGFLLAAPMPKGRFLDALQQRTRQSQARARPGALQPDSPTEELGASRAGSEAATAQASSRS